MAGTFRRAPRPGPAAQEAVAGCRRAAAMLPLRGSGRHEVKLFSANLEVI